MSDKTCGNCKNFTSFYEIYNDVHESKEYGECSFFKDDWANKHECCEYWEERNH